jgi:hypothetical protein
MQIAKELRNGTRYSLSTFRPLVGQTITIRSTEAGGTEGFTATGELVMVDALKTELRIRRTDLAADQYGAGNVWRFFLPRIQTAEVVT